MSHLLQTTVELDLNTLPATPAPTQAPSPTRPNAAASPAPGVHGPSFVDAFDSDSDSVRSDADSEASSQTGWTTPSPRSSTPSSPSVSIPKTSEAAPRLPGSLPDAPDVLAEEATPSASLSLEPPADVAPEQASPVDVSANVAFLEPFATTERMMRLYANMPMLRVRIPQDTHLTLGAGLRAYPPQPFAVTQWSALSEYGRALWAQALTLSRGASQQALLNSTHPIELGYGGWAGSVQQVQLVNGAVSDLKVTLGSWAVPQALASGAINASRWWSQSAEPTEPPPNVLPSDPLVAETTDFEWSYALARQATRMLQSSQITLTDAAMLFPPLRIERAFGPAIVWQPTAQQWLQATLHRGHQPDRVKIHLPTLSWQGEEASDWPHRLVPLTLSARELSVEASLDGAKTLRDLRYAQAPGAFVQMSGKLLAAASADPAAEAAVAHLKKVRLEEGYLEASAKLALQSPQARAALQAWLDALVLGPQGQMEQALRALHALEVSQLKAHAAGGWRALTQAAPGEASVPRRWMAGDPQLAGVLLGAGRLLMQTDELLANVAQHSELSVDVHLAPGRVRLSEWAATESLPLAAHLEARVPHAGVLPIRSMPEPAAAKGSRLATVLGAVAGAVVPLVRWALGLAVQLLMAPWRMAQAAWQAMRAAPQNPVAPIAKPDAPTSMVVAPVWASAWAQRLFGPRGLPLGGLVQAEIDGVRVGRDGKLRPQGVLRVFGLPMYSLDQPWIARLFSPQLPFADGFAPWMQSPAASSAPPLSRSFEQAAAWLGAFDARVQATLSPRHSEQVDASVPADPQQPHGARLLLRREPWVLRADFSAEKAPRVAIESAGVRLLSQASALAGASERRLDVRMQLFGHYQGALGWALDGAWPPTAGQTHWRLSAQARSESADSTTVLAEARAVLDATLGDQWITLSQLKVDVDGATPTNGDALGAHRALIERLGIGENPDLRALLVHRLALSGQWATPALGPLWAKATGAAQKAG